MSADLAAIAFDAVLHVVHVYMFLEYSSILCLVLISFFRIPQNGFRLIIKNHSANFVYLYDGIYFCQDLKRI